MDTNTLILKLSEVHGEICKILTTGKATLGANMDIIQFPPKSVDTINQLLAQRNLLLDLLKSESNARV